MKNTTTTIRTSLFIPCSLLMGAVLLSGFYLYTHSNARQYSSSLKTKNIEKEPGNDAAGMEQYFFNARKNNLTGKMDYAAMVNTENTIASMQAYRANHRITSGGLGLTWKGLGPSDVGGRTRAILIDNRDPTGNTLFAAAVSGGIWKSTNGGATWDSINDNLQSLEACCFAQDINGTIYCGTGEGFNIYSQGDGFSVAMLGGGIFKSTDDGKTFTRLPSTVPTPNNYSVPWAYTNRIAISPCNPGIIYAATNTGLYITKDTGRTWKIAWNSTYHRSLNSNSVDVKISKDGKVIIACVGGQGYVTYPSCGEYDTAFALVKNAGSGKLPNGDRIEFAIAPSNPSYIYASVVKNALNSLVGIYMSLDMGATWNVIGPGGSNLFNPYSSQGPYDNALAVFPTNPGEILAGGTTLWTWKQNGPNSVIGSWNNISHYGGFVGDPDIQYIHPDEHVIVFDQNHPNIAYLGCDGGIFKTTNVNAIYDPVNPTPPTWVPMNRDYNVTQFYAIDFAPYSNTNNQEGIMGGTQDNGTPYINGNAYYYEDESLDMSSGDGGGTAISFINPNVFFTCTAMGTSFNRGSNLSGVAFPSDFFTTTKGLNKGANMDSISRGTACFVMSIALYENLFDNNTIDSILWISDNNYKAGDTIHPLSPNGDVPFSYVLPEARAKGDSLIVKNPVVSKIAAGFTPSTYVWVCMQATDLADPIVWMPIGGPESKPDGFSGGDPVHCMAWSPDGDALFVGTEGGQLFRFSNLDSVRDSSYMTGAVISAANGKVRNPKCRVHSKNMTNMFFNPVVRDILSISVDRRNGNNVLVTLGNYGYTGYVYYSTNALSANPTFTLVQGAGVNALPAMPVYSSILNVDTAYPKSAVVGTEHGVYSTHNIDTTNPVWTADNNGAPNTLVLAMKQQVLPSTMCNNSGNIYIGTHGRGAFYTSSLGPLLGVPPVSAHPLFEGLKVYPNPMSTQGTVDFTLAKEDNITLTIYDLQGRIVKTIHLGKQIEGQHLVPIYTEEFNTGTYLVSLNGANFHKTARIVIVK